MEIILQGEQILTKKDFHQQFAKALDVEQFYGHNLDALWDLLGFGVERPLTLIWLNSAISKQNLGVDFDKIIDILQRVKEHDENNNWHEKFDFCLK